ncbi:MAG: HPr family phosphocarrier protein [Gemmatimonadales bacterium]
MIEQQIEIVNSLGLHARPAADFVKLASKFRADVWVSKGELEVNAKSIMGVLTLAAECGATVTVRADGVDAEDAVEALVELVSNGFGEE